MKKNLTLLLLLSCAVTVFGQKVASPSVVDPKEPAPEPNTELNLISLPVTSGNPSAPSSPLLPLTTSMVYKQEVEPNNTFATAMPLGSTDIKVKGNIFPNGDVDFYSFTAMAGDRVYAGVMTSKSSNGSTDSYLELIGTDGITVIEEDNDDGSFGALSSGIAGAVIPANGTYFIKVRHNSPTNQLRPYYLYLKVQSGTPVAEIESNDVLPGQAIPLSGWVSGSTSSTADVDFYSITLGAGETVFLSLDLDPERDNTTWNGQLGLGTFGTPPQILVVNDGNITSPNSETFYFTVKDAGTYSIYVGVPAGGTTFGTYHLSASVLPADNANCTTYSSTDIPVAIPTGPGIVTSTLNIADVKTIKKLRVSINLTHNFMADLDVELTSPSGNTVGLFSDIGSVTVGAQTTMDIKLNDDAAIPSVFTVVQNMELQTEPNYLLEWFKGQPSNGTWTLTIRDDATGDGGTLNSWSLEICEETPIVAGNTLFSTDFESGAAGFTHAGVQDEWQLGLPSFAPITTANSGTNCFKTDLTGTYNTSANADLLSPPIVIPTLGVGKAYVKWAMKFQMESATFDHAWVEVREVGNPSNSVKVWEWLGATMTNTVGNPIVTVQEAAGWGIYTVDISSFSGKTIEIVFHYDTDTTVELAGLAIDDVSVFTDCIPPSPPIASMANQTNICSGTSTSLAATCGSGEVKWYDATGTTLLFTGSPFTTPTLTNGITYKVLCDNMGCVSTFTDVVITIKPTPTSALSASKLDVCPNTEVSLNANCSEAGSTVNWNPGGATVTPNAPDIAYTYKASCTLNGCTGNESSIEVRTHRILVDLKDVGLGAQPKSIVGPKKDNLAPTNAISAAVSPRLWTILATGCSASESAVFKLTGPVSFSSIDNNPPYAIFANVGTTYFSIDHPNYGNGGSSFPNGIYNLVVDLRAADGAGGPFPKNRIATGSLLATRSLQFTVSTGGGRLGIEDLSLAESNWASIFQNPVSEEIVVRISGTVGEEVSLGLVNLQGQTVHSRQVKLSSPQQYEVLNVRQQNAGMYILKAIKGDKVKTIKVVKAE